MKSRKRHSSSSAPLSDPPGGMGKIDGGSKKRAHVGEDGGGSKKMIKKQETSNKRARIDKEDDVISKVKRAHIGSGGSSSGNPQLKERLNTGCKLASPPPLDDAAIKAKHIVAEDIEQQTILSKIEALLSAVALSIVQGNGYTYEIRLRSPRTMAYLPTHGVVHQRGQLIRFDFSKDFRKAIQMTCTLKVIAESIRQGVSVTKRFVYYRHREIFGSAAVTNTMLDHICCMFGCTISSLNVYIEPKGSVIGPLEVKLRNKRTLDCSVDWDGGGHRIPRTISIKSFEHHAERILVVEKKSIFHHLLQMNFHIEQSCIIITGSGEPDIATRAFLYKLHADTNLPVYALVDPDPFGVQILFVYAFGSINMSYANCALAVPEIQWIGLWHSDLLKELTASCLTETTPSEKKMLDNLLQHDILGIAQQHWRNRIRQMIHTKASIEALFSVRLSYLSKELLPALFTRKVSEHSQFEEVGVTKKMCCENTNQFGSGSGNS